MATGKTMPPSQPCGIDSREEWLLRLLYAPDEDGRSRPLYGQTRIVKSVFLLQKKLEEHFDESIGFNFTARKYGPHDNGVLEALECLQREGYVERIPERLHSSEYEGDEFRLTEAGKQEAKKLYNRRTESERELLHWVKYKQSTRSLGALLSYVYMEYPEMTKESESI